MAYLPTNDDDHWTWYAGLDQQVGWAPKILRGISRSEFDDFAGEVAAQQRDRADGTEPSGKACDNG